jgi:hypothetical protein
MFQLEHCAKWGNFASGYYALNKLYPAIGYEISGGE